MSTRSAVLPGRSTDLLRLASLRNAAQRQERTARPTGLELLAPLSSDGQAQFVPLLQRVLAHHPGAGHVALGQRTTDASSNG